MIHRIEVGVKKEIRDTLGEKTKKKIGENLGIYVENIKTVDVYTIEADLSKEELDILGRDLFADPVNQECSVDNPLTHDFDWLIEVGFKPGVTDNVAKTSKEAIKDVLKRDLKAEEAIYTSKQFVIFGKNLNKEILEHIARDFLANEMVQQWTIFDYKLFKESDFQIRPPKVEILHKPVIELIDLNVSDEELLNISKKRKLALNLEEMKIIKSYLGRPVVIEKRKTIGLTEKVTDAELEALAQSWSEHCKHKIFNAKIKYKNHGKEIEIDSLFKTYIKSSTKQLEKELDWVVSTLWDNSGVIRFNNNWLLAVKCETHNSPSNEEPYGGAITGIVGVYRDPMGTGRGCKLIYGTYGFCTGNPFYAGELRPKLHPRRLLEGVRKGVEDGGNKHGVPTPYGITFFDDGYIAKPAIYVLAAGIVPFKVNGEPGHKKEVNPGDLIVMCGGRVGIDGIHGATESSMEAGSWITAGHVQMGDPFTQKKSHDFLLEARDMGLFKGITDNGAGGLSSSVGEMAQLSNGFKLYLDKVPLKYVGLDPWQILVSESQERMTIAVPPEKIEKFLELAKKHDVEATVIGKFTNTGKFYCVYQDRVVTFLDMEFVHEGLPQMKLEAEWLDPQERGLYEPSFQDIENHNLFLREMLSRINICGKEYIVRQYDHEVQGTSIIKPLVGKYSDVHSDAVVLRPVLGTNEGVAISVGINPIYGKIDTYHMTALLIDEAIRRIIAVGGSLQQIALNDNFCWPSPLPSVNNPDAKYKLAQLIKANQALYDYTLAFKTPCVSGKDSMSMDGTIKDTSDNDHRISALPTLQFSAVGKIDDIRKCVTMDVKEPGDLVYILGITKDELGGSEYYEARGEIGLNVPAVDTDKAIKLYNSLSKVTDKELVNSIHGIYKGGLIISLAKSSFAGGYGMEINLDQVPTEGLNNIDKILYSESASRFIVIIHPESKKYFEDIMEGNIFKKIGSVENNENLKIVAGGKIIIDENIYKLKESWQKTFKDF